MVKVFETNKRPVRIGVLNIMPKIESYEKYILASLSYSKQNVQPVWIRLKKHCYKSSNRNRLNRFYVFFEEAIKFNPLDGLIITDAPVGRTDFAEILYWEELSEILN